MLRDRLGLWKAFADTFGAPPYMYTPPLANPQNKPLSEQQIPQNEYTNMFTLQNALIPGWEMSARHSFVYNCCFGLRPTVHVQLTLRKSPKNGRIPKLGPQKVQRAFPKYVRCVILDALLGVRDIFQAARGTALDSRGIGDDLILSRRYTQIGDGAGSAASAKPTYRVNLKDG